MQRAPLPDRIDPVAAEHMGDEDASAEQRRKGRISQIEPARIGAERRHDAAHAIGDETAPPQTSRAARRPAPRDADGRRSRRRPRRGAARGARSRRRSGFRHGPRRPFPPAAPDRDCRRSRASRVPFAGLRASRDRRHGAARRPAVMEGIAERGDRPRPVAQDEKPQSRERRRRIIGRQQHAPRCIGRTLFEMQIGDDQEPVGLTEQRAGGIGDENGAGDFPEPPPASLPPAIPLPMRSRVHHPMASSTSTPAASARIRSSRLAIDRLAADLQHDRHRQRRNAVEILMDDSPGDAREHFGEPAEIEQARRRRRRGPRAAGCGRARGGAARRRRDRWRSVTCRPDLLLAGKAALDQARDRWRRCGKCASSAPIPAAIPRDRRPACPARRARRARTPALARAPTSASDQTASAYSLATKPSGLSPARSMRRVSSMPSV